MKIKVLNWLRQFSTFCFLDSNHYEHRENHHEMLIGAGVKRKLESSSPEALRDLQQFIDAAPAWLFGHLAYELTTSEHGVHSRKSDRISFPDLFFFEPEILIRIRHNTIEIFSDHPDRVFEAIGRADSHAAPVAMESPVINSKISREGYIDIVKKLQHHIQRGDCYEINFCQEFYAEHIDVDPVFLYEKLSRVSPNPFSGLYRIADKWLVCASPERFLQKKGRVILSQPIKGTLPRNHHDERLLQDERRQLKDNAKEQAENVMVVDLVRNDLSRICEEGSVKVDELFGIYTFPQVHQMISTISGTLKDDIGFAAIMNATFPMGSMTGAPKIKVMELIRQYEKSSRGIFSGTLGYISPGGDFDCNVVIRSLMYHSGNRYLSFQAGSGITIYSDAEKEWEECLVKVEAIRRILGNTAD